LAKRSTTIDIAFLRKNRRRILLLENASLPGDLRLNISLLAGKADNHAERAPARSRSMDAVEEESRWPRLSAHYHTLDDWQRQYIEECKHFLLSDSVKAEDMKNDAESITVYLYIHNRVLSLLQQFLSIFESIGESWPPCAIVPLGYFILPDLGNILLALDFGDSQNAMTRLLCATRACIEDAYQYRFNRKMNLTAVLAHEEERNDTNEDDDAIR